MTTPTLVAGVARAPMSRARLELWTPLSMHHIEVAKVVGVLVAMFILARSVGFGLDVGHLMYGVIVTTLTYVRGPRRRARSVRASIQGEVLFLRGWLSRLRVHPRDVARLRVDHHPCRMHVVLCDGRVLEIDDVDARVAWAFEARIARFSGPETFKLTGIPSRGGTSKVLSAMPFLSGLVRPRLRLSKDSLRLWWGPFSLDKPLCQLTLAKVTTKGFLLRFADKLELEVLTYGGLCVGKEWTTFELNRIVTGRILHARQRALSRSFSSYRRRITALAPDSD